MKRKKDEERRHDAGDPRGYREGSDPFAEDLGPEGVEPGGALGPESTAAPSQQRSSKDDSTDAELARLRAREDELLRALAEQQNVMRRRRQETESSVKYAQESLVRELLPVLDDFERALQAMEGNVEPSIRAGVALVYERLNRILEAQGLEAVRPLGRPFDPELHDAVAQEPSTDSPPGTVVAVAQPGYRFRGRVLRHAKVVVAGPSEAGAPAPLTSERDF